MVIAVLHDLRVGATLAVVPDPATRGGEGCRKGSPYAKLLHKCLSHSCGFRQFSEKVIEQPFGYRKRWELS